MDSMSQLKYTTIPGRSGVKAEMEFPDETTKQIEELFHMGLGSSGDIVLEAIRQMHEGQILKNSTMDIVSLPTVRQRVAVIQDQTVYSDMARKIADQDGIEIQKVVEKAIRTYSELRNLQDLGQKLEVVTPPTQEVRSPFLLP